VKATRGKGKTPANGKSKAKGRKKKGANAALKQEVPDMKQEESNVQCITQTGVIPQNCTVRLDETNDNGDKQCNKQDMPSQTDALEITSSHSEATNVSDEAQPAIVPVTEGKLDSVPFTHTRIK